LNDALFPVFLFLLASLAWAIYYRFLHLRKRRESEMISLITRFTAVSCYRRSLPRLQREIARSRRLQRPMSIIVIRPKLGCNRQDAGGLDRIEFLLCGASFINALRDMDVIAFDSAHDQFVIALPESSRTQATHTIDRLAGLIGKTMADRIHFGTVAFPEDGLNIDDLVTKAGASAGQIATSTTVDGTIKQVRTYASN